jgi:hypothetical protein
VLVNAEHLPTDARYHFSTITADVYRRVLDGDVLGHKNTPADAVAFAGVISTKLVSAVSKYLEEGKLHCLCLFFNCISGGGQS